MKRVLCIVCILTCWSFGTVALADDTAERLKKLEDTVQNQSKTIEEQQNTIDSLKENSSKQKNQASPQKGQAPQQTNQELQQQVQELNEKVDQVVEAQKKVLPSEFNPVHRARGRDDLLLSQQGIDGRRAATGPAGSMYSSVRWN